MQIMTDEGKNQEQRTSSGIKYWQAWTTLGHQSNAGSNGEFGLVIQLVVWVHTKPRQYSLSPTAKSSP
jgi:hypothetical protein